MLKELKRAKEIVFHPESGNGYYAVDHELKHFNLQEIEDFEAGKYILENGKQVKYHYDIECKKGTIFSYTIYNNGEYEFAESSTLYSLQYFTEEEFKQMCEEAQKEVKREGEREKSVYEVSMKLRQLYPLTFIRIATGQGFNTYEWD